MLLVIEPVLSAQSAISVPQLLTGGYSFESSSYGSGGSVLVRIGKNKYPIMLLFMMVVMFCSIVFTTVLSTFHIHRYFLRKNIKNIEIDPYLRVMWIGLGVYVLTLILSFTLVFSLWFVIFVAWATQITGFILFRKMNRRQGYPLDNRDIRGAYLMSTASISFILFLFL
jgi:hypothetical protein